MEKDRNDLAIAHLRWLAREVGISGEEEWEEVCLEAIKAMEALLEEKDKRDKKTNYTQDGTLLNTVIHLLEEAPNHKMTASTLAGLIKLKGRAIPTNTLDIKLKRAIEAGLIIKGGQERYKKAGVTCRADTWYQLVPGQVEHDQE